MSKEIDALLGKAFSGDGAPLRVSDLYQSCRDALVLAIRSGEDFDTGWWGVKKQNQIGRIRRKGQTTTCEVYVSDNFKETGYGKDSFTIEDIMHPQRIMRKISRSLNQARRNASDDLRETCVVSAFSIFRNGVGIGSYLAPKGKGRGLKRPPGKDYSHWGVYYVPSDQLTEDHKMPVPDNVLAYIAAFCEDPQDYKIDVCRRRVFTFKDDVGDEYKLVEWDSGWGEWEAADE